MHSNSLPNSTFTERPILSLQIFNSPVPPIHESLTFGVKGIKGQNEKHEDRMMFTKESDLL